VRGLLIFHQQVLDFFGVGFQINRVRGGVLGLRAVEADFHRRIELFQDRLGAVGEREGFFLRQIHAVVQAGGEDVKADEYRGHDDHAGDGIDDCFERFFLHGKSFLSPPDARGGSRSS